MRYEIRKAAAEDGPSLNHFAEAQAMGGEVAISLSRSPDYFKAFEVEGLITDVIVVKDTQTSRIVATGARSEREVHINDRTQRLGYLSSLRIAPDHRKGSVLWRGYEFLRELHQGGEVPAYLCAIFQSNHEALSILSSGRGPLPLSRDIGTYYSCVFIPGSREVTSDKFSVRTMKPTDASTVTRFISTHGPRQRQFFPRYSEEDLDGSSGPLLGLSTDSVLLLEEGGELRGTVAIWDQSNYRHWKIPPGSLAAIQYPREVEPKVVFLALICVVDDDLVAFDALLRAALERGQNGDIIIAGFHERDPLLKVAQQRSMLSLESSLHLFYWQDDRDFVESITVGTPYVEAGSL